MKYHLENITYVEFFNKLNHFVDLVSKEKVNLENPKNEILNFLSVAVMPDSDAFELFLDSFFYSRYDWKKPDLDTEFSEFEIDDFTTHYRKLIDYFSIIDYFDSPKERVLVSSITEKSDFLLKKLYKIFNDNFYSVSLIFDLNNIEYRHNEPREIAENLSKRGYLILENTWGNSDNSKLSVKGANYVERKLKSNSKEKRSSIETSELDEKLNKIIQYVTKLGFGQEIIFEEIEELRDLQTKLSKKSWTQLLKGKLFDLAIDEALNQETANEVFEFLSNSTKKLIG